MIDRQTLRILRACTRLQVLKEDSECPTDSRRSKAQGITATLESSDSGVGNKHYVREILHDDTSIPALIA